MADTPVLDPNIDLTDILNQAKNENANKVEQSPLDAAINNRSNQTSGMVINNSELRDERPTNNNAIGAEERGKDLKDFISEHDDFIEKRNHVVLLEPLRQEKDWLLCMEEINKIVIENGVARYTTEPKYTRLRKDNEPLFNWEGANVPQPVNTNNETESIDTETTTETPTTDKKKVVEILIDKTGYGADIVLTGEEKADIQTAEVIQIKEVKTVPVNTFKMVKPQKSFLQVINSFDYDGRRIPMWFPASGFRAEFKGLTCGEYTDIAISVEKPSYDNYHKQLSIIYNKMVNPSHQFKDFDDFISHFAYTDVPLAIYAIFLATESDEQDIKITCGKKECKKEFNHHYKTTSILRYDECSEEFLDKFHKIAAAQPDEFEDIYNQSIVNNIDVIELPNSKLEFSIGILSAKEFLTNYTPLMDEEYIKSLFDDKEPDEAYTENIALLGAIHAVYVKTTGDERYEFTSNRDILDAIYNLPPEDLSIISNYAAEMLKTYEAKFALTNTKCPYCGHVTKSLAFDITELVFQRFLTSRSTTINVRKV